ncbi:Protein MEMO1 [Schistosoma japonicum]|nr:Protein MEMO1 [Schistosoma japonicum]
MGSPFKSVRVSLHCGSWYSADRTQLSSQLSTWLESCESSVLSGYSVRAIIVPHAGYRHSGFCAAHAYRQINPDKIERIFILGPSHRLDIGDTCALTCVSEYETPFCNLKIDTDIYSDLKKLSYFKVLTKNQDEAEHSVEMQLPFIAYIMKGKKDQYSIVPVVVGCLSTERQELFGKLLSNYLLDEKNLFVISSDFCHWGKRFRYQYYDKSDGAIWQSIEKLDHLGLGAIQSLKPESFLQYLKKFSNTICGRRSIGLLLFMIDSIRQKQLFNLELKVLYYTQSNRCQSMEDSSVSYAACAFVKCD